MKIGLLWFDDNPTRTLQEKVESAARRYYQRFRAVANTCYIHSSTLEKTDRVGRIHIIPKSNILPHHFWIGRQEGMATKPAPPVTERVTSLQ